MNDNPNRTITRTRLWSTLPLRSVLPSSLCFFIFHFQFPYCSTHSFTRCAVAVIYTACKRARLTLEWTVTDSTRLQPISVRTKVVLQTMQKTTQRIAWLIPVYSVDVMLILSSYPLYFPFFSTKWYCWVSAGSESYGDVMRNAFTLHCIWQNKNEYLMKNRNWIGMQMMLHLLLCENLHSSVEQYPYSRFGRTKTQVEQTACQQKTSSNSCWAKTFCSVFCEFLSRLFHVVVKNWALFVAKRQPITKSNVIFESKWNRRKTFNHNKKVLDNLTIINNLKIKFPKLDLRVDPLTFLFILDLQRGTFAFNTYNAAIYIAVTRIP